MLVWPRSSGWKRELGGHIAAFVCDPVAEALTMRSGPIPPVIYPLLGSVLAWAVLCIALPPDHQNFPLNDDWAFARGAWDFAAGKGIHYGGWASMPQLGQWLWAAPFLWVLGQSHFALRMATVVLSWMGLWAFHDLLRQQGMSPWRAAFTTGALAACPLFVLLQGTFMTDVPALSLALAALALYGRALHSRRLVVLAGACAVAVLAAITRQNTTVVCVVAAVLLGKQPDLRRRWAWWLGALLPIAAGVAVHFWFQARTDVRALAPSLPDVSTLLSLPYVGLHLLALAAIPVLLAPAGPTGALQGKGGPLAGASGLSATRTSPKRQLGDTSPKRQRQGPVVSRWVLGLGLVFLAACAWACWALDKDKPADKAPIFPYPLLEAEGGRQRPLPGNKRPQMVRSSGLFPYTENMITPWGAFAGSNFTGTFMVGHRPLLLGAAGRWLLTIAGCLAGGVLIARLVLGRRWSALTRPLTLFTLLQVPFLLVAPDLYDRYFLFLLPGALALVWGEGQEGRDAPLLRLRWCAALVVLVVLALVSVGLMHDWLAWNSARWELGRRAVASGVPPLDIEGGVEWDGWFDSLDEPTAPVPPSPLKLRFTKEWFPAIRGRYALSFSEEPGTRRIDAEPYDVWLPPGRRELFLIGLLRAPGAPGQGPPGSR
jgi:hypothetical protein